VLVGYGIELTFTPSSQAIQKLVQAKSDAESRNSSVSIFGCIYNSNSKSFTLNPDFEFLLPLELEFEGGKRKGKGKG